MNNENIPDVTTDDSTSSKYDSSLVKGLISRYVAANTNSDIADAHRLFTNAKIVVPLKYLSNFYSSLEMLLINCKIHLELNWTKNYVMCTVGDSDNKTTFKITSTKFHVLTATLSAKNDKKIK